MAAKTAAKKSIPRRILKAVLIVLLVIVALVVVLFATLTITEYKPDDVEQVEVRGVPTETLAVGESFDVLTWNIGYCGLSAGADFFMDGGTNTRSVDEAGVQDNLANIIDIVDAQDADVVFLQEVDANSTRTYGIDEQAAIASAFSSQYTSAVGTNYKCLFVPFPLPPIGKVDSGIMTLSSYGTCESVPLDTRYDQPSDARVYTANRMQLPCPFSWPVRTANLKRCLLVERVDLEGTDAQLVLVNLHLEAYDSGEGKLAQTNMLVDFMEEEYAQGNYVIAGGDFNQTFSAIALSTYPLLDENYWNCGRIYAKSLGPDFQLVMDESTPTCRLLNTPYISGDPSTQFYMIDGFICTKNVHVNSVETIDADFQYSDHNPVRINLTLL